MTKQISLKMSFNHQISKQIANLNLQWGNTEISYSNTSKWNHTSQGKGVGGEGVCPRIQKQKVAGLNPVVIKPEWGHQS